MVDTARTQAQLLTLFANNTTGAISPQDLRDFVVSVMGIIGGIYTDGGSTAQAGVTTTPEKMTGFAANSGGTGVTEDHTDDSLTLPNAGTYEIKLNVSFSGTLNTTWDFEIALDGVATGYKFQRKLSAGGDIGDASCFGLVAATANQKLTVLVNSDAGGGASFTAVHAQLIASRKI